MLRNRYFALYSKHLVILAVTTFIFYPKTHKSIMYILKLSTLFLSLGLFIASCGGSDKPDAEVSEPTQPTTPTTETSSYDVNTEASVINWRGFKPTGSSHNGTLKISSGVVSVENGQLTGGNFVVDMNTLDNDDLKGSDGYEKLLGHLKSPDFFSVDEYPEAKLEITSVEEAAGENGTTHNISGNLTIKDVTKNITFPATVNVTESGVDASAAFVVDRSEFNVKFGSKDFFPDLVGDKVISDDLELTVKLIAGTPATM